MTETLAPGTDPLKRRNRELSILNSIAQALNRTVDLEQALSTALAQVTELLDLDTGWVWLLREEAGDFYLAAAQNLPPGLVRHPELMEGSCYCLDTFRAGDLSGAANISMITCSRLKKLVGGTAGLRYHASIPLYAHGKQLGVLNVATDGWRELSPEELRLLYTIGDLVSIAVERARLFARQAEFGAAEERSRLAREIHDTLAQGLAGITLQLETADSLLEAGADPERARQAVQQALALARANMEEARRSVLDLRAAPLEGRGLMEALEHLAHETQVRTGLPVAFEVTGSLPQLPALVEVGLYRIAQEGLSNAARHSGAEQAWLKLDSRPEAVLLIIRDNGRGFDPARLAPGQPAGHYGLLGLNERAHLLGGQVEIQTGPGFGTKIEVSVPTPGKQSAGTAGTRELSD